MFFFASSLNFSRVFSVSVIERLEILSMDALTSLMPRVLSSSGIAPGYASEYTLLGLTPMSPDRDLLRVSSAFLSSSAFCDSSTILLESSFSNSRSLLLRYFPMTSTMLLRLSSVMSSTFSKP